MLLLLVSILFRIISPSSTIYPPKQLKQFVAASHLVVQRHGAVNQIMQHGGVDIDEVGDVFVGRFGVEIAARHFDVKTRHQLFFVRRQIILFFRQARGRLRQQRVVLEFLAHALQTLDKGLGHVLHFRHFVLPVTEFLYQSGVLQSLA